MTFVRRNCLISLILCLSIFFVDETLSQAATQDDIAFLQGQITQQGQDLAALANAVNALAPLADDVAVLQQEMGSANARLSTLEAQSAGMSQLLDETVAIVNVVVQDLVQLTTVVDGLSATVTGLTGAVGLLNSTTQRLHKVNQLWRHNFRVTNDTFRKIRKKIAFKVPVFKVVTF